MNVMKKVITVFLLISLVITMQAFTAVAQEPADYQTITVGINGNYPPFQYENEDGFAGFEIEMMNLIGEIAGYNVKYVNMPFEDLITAVNEGRVDCALSLFIITQERRQTVEFSMPYLSSVTTYDNNGNEEEYFEDYAIVFKKGAKESDRTDSAFDTTAQIYYMVGEAIQSLRGNGTIEELIAKYGLNTVEDNGYYKCTYFLNDYSHNYISEWAADYIAQAEKLNITDPGAIYDYDADISREQFCELIYNYIESIGKLDLTNKSNYFADTNNEKIAVLNNMGIIFGKTETEFRPDDNLTREEAAVIITRMINKTIPIPVTEMYFDFDDSSEISDWAADSVQTVCNMGVMNGIGNNRFAPQELYTVEQAIAVLVRIYEIQVLNNESVAADDEPAVPKFPVVDVELDDFYIDKAQMLAQKTVEHKNLWTELYGIDKDVIEEVMKTAETDFHSLEEVYCIRLDYEKIIKKIEEEYPDINLSGIKEEDFFGSSVFIKPLQVMINSIYGSDSVMISLIKEGEGFIMPEGYSEDFTMYLKCPGAYSCLAAFSKIGEQVIYGEVRFVINGEDDDFINSLNDFYDLLGEGSITLERVNMQ